MSDVDRAERVEDDIEVEVVVGVGVVKLMVLDKLEQTR